MWIHYLNQCWNIVNSNLRNKLQWNLNRNSYIFIQENAFENVVCEMAAFCLGLGVLMDPCDPFYPWLLHCSSAEEEFLKEMGNYVTNWPEQRKAKRKPYEISLDMILILSQLMSPVNCCSSVHTSLLEHIGACTKWPTFCRWHFRMHFLQRNNRILIQFRLSLLSWPNVKTGSRNDFAPLVTRCWTDDDHIYWELQWLHNERDGVSNHRRLGCLLSPLFGRRSNKTSKLCVTGFCEGNPSVTTGFPS